MAGHVGGAQAHIEQLGHLQRLLPERTRHGQRIGNRDRAIDQDVEPTMLATHALEQCCHLGVITMVAGHGNARAARSRHIGRRLAYGTGQGRVALFHAAPRHIDRRTRSSQCQRHTAAHATTGTRDYAYQSLAHSGLRLVIDRVNLEQVLAAGYLYKD